MALTVAVAVTTTLKIATGICLITQHDPLTLAKQIASLDQLSGGRFLFGIGGGWNVEEIENHGTVFKTRFRQLREKVLVMKEIWTQDEAEFHGDFVDFDKIWAFPKPLQKPHPPIIMGGDGPTTFDRVIEFCDGWMPIQGRAAEGPDLPEKIAILKQRATDAGRDSASISISVFAARTTQENISRLGEAGVERVVFSLPAADKETVLPLIDEYAKLID